MSDMSQPGPSKPFSSPFQDEGRKPASAPDSVMSATSIFRKAKPAPSDAGESSFSGSDEEMPPRPEPTALHQIGENPPPAGEKELLQVIDAVAREKGIAVEEVIEAMEMAIRKAGASKYGHQFDIRARFDRDTGHIFLSRRRLIVDEVEDTNQDILLEEAQRLKPDVKLGEAIVEPLPSIDFGRVAAQTAKQIIIQRVRDAERAHQYEAFKDRVGEIVSGTVKRVEYGNVVVDLGRGEAILRREDLLGRETFRRADRVRAYIYDVRREMRGPQIFLSRAHKEFIKGLFSQEVPEIYDGVVEIKAVATEPGSRAKIAVLSNDSSVDPVGTCVGMRGSRVQAVVNELQGQKIDIIPWSEDTATFVVNALTPAEVIKVIIDEDAGRIDVVVPEDQLSFAIGRRGQNVRLASQLSGWHIDVLSEAKESERRNEEFKSRSKVFMDELDVDDVISHLLVAEGFTTIEELAEVPREYLSNIEEFDERIIQELYERAQNWLKNRKEKIQKRLEELKVDDVLLTMPHLVGDDVVTLGEKGITTRDNLADLASDELREVLPDKKMTEEQANETIMQARAHWFEDEPSSDSALPTPAEESTASTPAEESTPASPSSATSKDKDVAGVSTPGEELTVPTPAEESTPASPSSATSKDKEVAGVSTPGEELTVPTPAEESTVPTPGEELTASTSAADTPSAKEKLATEKLTAAPTKKSVEEPDVKTSDTPDVKTSDTKEKSSDG